MIEGILDTNIIIDLLHLIPSALMWGNSVVSNTFAVTSIVWFETMNGARNKVELARTIKFISRFPIEPTIAVDEDWARAQFIQYQLNHGVEYQDSMIAAIAVRLNIPLYTRNTRHFAVLPNLDLGQPY
ncbi:MAG: PIN domain-containing protein [Chloroflexota bacterium]|nr:PIN domain-containing protein [Chloroflexota bacterium]